MLRSSSSTNLSSTRTAQSPKPLRRVTLIDHNDVHPFETEIFDPYEMSSGTFSYSSAPIADLEIQAAAVKAAQDERDHQTLKAVTQQLLDPNDKSPAIIPLSDYALRAVNRTERIKVRSRSLRRPDSAATQRIRIQPHTDDDMECELMGNMIEDAVKMALSGENPTGKSLSIRLGVVDEAPMASPRRTLEFRTLPNSALTSSAITFASPTVTEVTTTEQQLTPKQEMIEALAAEEQQKEAERHSAPLNPPAIHSLTEIVRRSSIQRRRPPPPPSATTAVAIRSRPLSGMRRWMRGLFSRRATGPQGGGFRQPDGIPRRQ